MAKKKNKKKKGLFGLFGGKGKDDEATTPGGEKIPEHDMTIMPGYASGPAAPEGDPGIGEMTMAPGYVQHIQPESSGEIGAVSFGNQTPGSLNPSSPGDEFVAGEMTMAPGYAADLGNQSDYAAPRPGGADPFTDPPPGGGPDPFGAALGGTSAAPPDPFGDPMAPGPDAPDPFADAIPSDAGGGARDPFGDPMAPAGGTDPFGMGGPPAADGARGGALGAMTPGSDAMDPTAETFAVPGGGAEPEFGGMDPAEMTMVPGYAGGDLGTRGDWAKPSGGAPGPGQADPFGTDLGAGEMTMAPGYAGATPGGQPPSDDMFASAEMTMAPGYAGGGQAPPADPFGADLGGAATPAAGADPFGADLGAGELTMAPSYSAQGGGPTDPFGGPDPFGGDLGGPSASPSAAEAAALGAGADPNDPFGPALLDQPTDSISPDEFAERTMVDMPSDIAELEVLRPTTEELQLEGLGLDAALGGTREMFSSFRREGQEAVASGLDGEVHHDIQRGLIFAGPVEDGWRVLPGLRRLSDGSVVGKVRVDESGDFRWGIPLDAELIAGVLHVTLPSSAQYDPETRALRIPEEQATQLAWRPARTWVDGEGGLCFLLPPEVTHCEGRLEVPQEDAPPPVEIDPALPHGALISERSYLGLTERAYADGWTSLELGPGAEITSEGLEVDAKARGTRPALLEVEALPCGQRARVALPPLARNENGLLWLPPLAGEELVEEDDFLELASVRESRTYLGLRDELLESGWVRLVLPESAKVAEGVLTLQGSGEDAPASLRGAFDFNSEGSLTFRLPEGSEVLGDVVLIPPGGDDLVTDTWASPSQSALTAPDPGPRRWSARDEADAGTKTVEAAEVEAALDPAEETVIAPPAAEEPAAEEPAAEEPAAEAVAEEPAAESVAEETVADPPADAEGESSSGKKKSKKLSGLARFRGSKPENDVVEFSGVLEPSDEASALKEEAKATEDEAKATEDEAKATEDEAKATEDEAKATEDEAKATEDEAKATEDEAEEASKPKPKPKRKTRKRTSRKKKTE